MTRLEAFKMLFPKTVYEDGYPDLLPCQFEPCAYPPKLNCLACDCEESFWNEEVNFKFVKE